MQIRAMRIRASRGMTVVHTSYNDAFATQMNMSVEHDIHSSFIASVWP